ncbi:MAG: hypothetical protein JNM43_28800 [Planctomycetaceae bacterium]|nr:hypothetical protein [Planctomycetaceae bacterium]
MLLMVTRNDVVVFAGRYNDYRRGSTMPKILLRNCMWYRVSCLVLVCLLIFGILDIGNRFARHRHALAAIRRAAGTDSVEVIGDVRIFEIPAGSTSVSVGVVAAGLRRGAVFVLRGESAHEVVHGVGSDGIENEIAASVQGRQAFAFAYREGSGIVRCYVGVILLGEKQEFWRLEVGCKRRAQLRNDATGGLLIGELETIENRHETFEVVYVEGGSHASHGELKAVCESFTHEAFGFDFVTSF